MPQRPLPPTRVPVVARRPGPPQYHRKAFDVRDY
jgi:hypothetical protein